jgi:Family of unknown function (DUF5681)
MSERSKYAVGRGRPPLHTRFRPGVSGNPSGRPKGVTRASTLMLKEGYRLLTVREGDQVVQLPAIQAVMRSWIALAAKGNGPAQRALLAMLKDIEEAQAETKRGEAKADQAVAEAVRTIGSQFTQADGPTDRASLLPSAGAGEPSG